MDADAVHRAWLERSGEYSPGYYAYYGSNEISQRLCETIDSLVAKDAAILELGCSVGRHLAYLADQGYTDLTGVDINPEAFEEMKRTYPALADIGTFHAGAIEDIITEFDDDRFDVVYSVETLAHIPEDNQWVFEDIARVTDQVLVTVEVEDGRGSPPETAVNFVRDGLPLYYRDWGQIFTDLGFEQTERTAIKNDTYRVFRAGDS